MAYSFGLLGFGHQQTLRALGDHAIPKLPNFKAEEFSIMIYSFGLVNFRHHDLLAAMLTEVPAALPRFSTQNISNFLHGLGLVNYDRDDGFVRTIVDHLITRLPDCTPQDISNPITALMRMSERHDELMHAVAACITSPSTHLPVTSFSTQNIANIIYGFDALQVFDQRLFEITAEETSKRLETFIPQEVANIIWAFAKQSFGSPAWYEDILARCAPFAELPAGAGSGNGLSVFWGSEDLEKPLGALWPMRAQLPSFQRIETVFRDRFLDRIAAFLCALAPQLGSPAPAQYQKDFAAWDLYQVGPLYTEELLGSVGVQRGATPSARALDALMKHYIDTSNEESLLSKHGDKLLFTVLPAARWVACHMSYRLHLEGDVANSLCGDTIVDAPHPKEDDSEANQRRFKAESWRQPVELPGAAGAFRPTLLSTFLGNYRHRHTELVACDALVDLVLQAVASGQWHWSESFWQGLGGEVEFLVPHTPCLSCVGAFTQLRCWAPNLRVTVVYEDWREWRRRLRTSVGLPT